MYKRIQIVAVAVGVEIPDYVTHQGTAAVRGAVSQQFKNVLDSAGRKRK
jgi:hypothetical protein